MADIFISYARPDRAKVERLAAALQSEGWSVWWDRNIQSGAEFSAEIERELHDAGAVIVCWSEEGAKSRWVRDEATLASRENKLKTISLDGTEPPIGYMQYHALDMSGWFNGDDAIFAELRGAIAGFFDKLSTGAPTADISPAPGPTAAATAAKSFTTAPIKILAGAALALTAAVIGVLFITNRSDGTGERAGTSVAAAESSIAVLPFVNMSSDPEQEFFSDGISEELLNVLAKVDGLQVAGRTSAFAFKGKNTDLREIAEILDVAHILEGSVRKSGDKVRVTAQLIRADNGFHLWSETYDRKLDDIFYVQDEISSAILTELTPHLLGKAEVHTTRTDINAYELYLAAKQHAAPGNLGGYEAAAEALDKAIEIDPNFAPALAWRAYYELMMSDGDGAAGDIPVEEATVTATALIERAMEIDPASPDAIFAHAGNITIGHRPGDAEEYYKRAIAAKPNFPLARNDYAFMLVRQGRLAEGRDQLEQALAHNPAQADANVNIVNLYHLTNNLDAAEDALDRWNRILPDNLVYLSTKASHLWRSGDRAAAMKLAEDNLKKLPDDPRVRWQTAVGWLRLGAFDRALEIDSDEFTPKVHLLRGDYDEAISVLKSKFEKRPDYRPAQGDYAEALLLSRQWDELVSFYDEKWGSVRAFRDNFEIPPYEYFLTPLMETGHPHAVEMRAAARAFSEEGRNAGFDFNAVEREEAFILIAEGKPDDAITRLEAMVEKNGLPMDIGFNPVLIQLADKPAYRAVVDHVEERINDSRTELGLDPIKLRRGYE